VQNARDELTADREIGSKSETSGSTLSKPDATAYSASFGQKSRESDVEEIVKYVERERAIQECWDAPAWRRAKWWLLGRSAAD
jgi:hypothetical protein